MCDLTNPAFTNEDKAREYLEKSRWPDGPVCPFCGQFETVKALGGKSMGPGWYHCSDCREKFTVRVGTLYERSHIALHKWLLATHLMTSSKKGISAHQLHRMLGVTYKTAWFMAHRIREAMTDRKRSPVGGEGKRLRLMKPSSAVGRQTALTPRRNRRSTSSCRWSSAAARFVRCALRT